MKLSPTLYAQAFVELARGTPARELPELAARLWRTVFRHRRFGWRQPIVAEVTRLWQQAHGVQPVRVAAAHELSEPAQGKLARELGAALNAKVELEVEYKPHLLAGAVVTVGDTRYDASLKGRLDRLYRALAGSERP